MAPVLVNEHAPSQKPWDEGGPSLVVEQLDTIGEPENERTRVGGQKGQSQPPSAHSDQGPTRVCTLSTASERSNTSPQPELKLKTTFMMVIHLPGEKTTQRLARLDTASDFDIISQQVVDTLDLEIDEYTGERVQPIGPITNSFMPQGQVTLDWHVATKHKTNTTTFVVFNEEHSDEFDFLLGSTTIGRLEFLIRNTKVYVVSAGRE